MHCNSKKNETFAMHCIVNEVISVLIILFLVYNFKGNIQLKFLIGIDKLPPYCSNSVIIILESGALNW